MMLRTRVKRFNFPVQLAPYKLLVLVGLLAINSKFSIGLALVNPTTVTALLWPHQ